MNDNAKRENDMDNELRDGIAAYKRTWCRFDGAEVSAQCGDRRVRGTFSAGECQPTITEPDGRRFVVRDLGSLRVEEA